MWENIDYDPFHILSALKNLQSFILHPFHLVCEVECKLNAPSFVMV